MLAVQHPVRPPTPNYGAYRHHRGRSMEVSPVASNRIIYEKAHSPQRQRSPAYSCRITTTVTLDTTTEKAKTTTPPPLSPDLSTPSSLSSSPSAIHSSSASYDYFDSPPSPPQSLEDQVHIAYALEDIHLAKVLLLKLKGIDVTGDDDPRIAAVKDEDFDFCFVPNGRLADGMENPCAKGMEDERTKWQRDEVEEEQKRLEKLRECERKWEDEKRRLREEREIARRQREDKRREEDEQARKECEESLRQQQRRKAVTKMALSRTHCSPARNLVSYQLSSQDAGSTQTVGNDAEGQPFMYDFMITTTPPQWAPCSATSSTPPSLSHSLPAPPTFANKLTVASPFPRVPRSQSHSQTQYLDYSYPHHSETNSRTVTFSEVLTAMQGPLFPGDKKASVNNLSTSSGSGKSTLVGSAYSHYSVRLGAADEKKRKQNDLLESLLKVIEWDHGERTRRKGKARADSNCNQRPKVTRKESGKSIKLGQCSVCSSSPLLSSPASTSSTSSSPSSRLSWLSFSSTASISSLATTPSTSPSLLLESPTSSRFGKRGSSWFASSGSFSKESSPLRQKSCPHTHLIPISASESPLPIPAVKAKVHRRSGSKLAAVSTSSNPLNSPFSSIARVEFAHTPKPLTDYAKAEPRPSNKVVTVVRSQVMKFFEIAKGFQDAYVNATILSVSSMTPMYDSKEVSVVRRNMERRGSDVKGGREVDVKPTGTRVNSEDVKKFTGTPLRRSSSSQLATSRCQLHQYRSSGDPIDLQPHFKVVPPSPPMLRTPLPEILSHQTRFKPVHQPCRSPFRLRTSRSPAPAPYSRPTHPYSSYQEEDAELPPPPKSMFSPVVLPLEEMPRGGRSPSESRERIVRVRAVENPVCLRVKAACRRYLDHRAGDHFRGGKGKIPIEEGPLPVMRDGSLGGGGERLLQVVLEGIGRSNLAEPEEETERVAGAGRRCFDLPVFEDSDSEDEMTDEEDMVEMVEFITTKSNSPYHSVRVQVSLSERQVQQMQRGRQRERGGRSWVR